VAGFVISGAELPNSSPRSLDPRRLCRLYMQLSVSR